MAQFFTHFDQVYYNDQCKKGQCTVFFCIFFDARKKNPVINIMDSELVSNQIVIFASSLPVKTDQEISDQDFFRWGHSGLFCIFGAQRKNRKNTAKIHVNESICLKNVAPRTFVGSSLRCVTELKDQVQPRSQQKTFAYEKVISARANYVKNLLLLWINLYLCWAAKKRQKHRKNSMFLNQFATVP